LLDQPGAEYVRLAEVTRTSFQRFWNARALRCYDVLDGPEGNDARLRPNQIFTASLSHSPLVREQRAAVVQVCERKLLTWYGLRTLAPGEPGYRRHYAGNPVQRDEAYHQGTVWGWLLGPFVLAHFRLYHDAGRARRLLQPFVSQLWTGTLGTLGEVFDAQEPFRAGGCFAQAWSVAETLRAWWIPHRLDDGFNLFKRQSPTEREGRKQKRGTALRRCPARGLRFTPLASLGRLDVDSLQPLGTLGDLKLDALAFAQRAMPLGFDRRVVNEHVLPVI
jgi:glycogen debranching enzyme